MSNNVNLDNIGGFNAVRSANQAETRRQVSDNGRNTESVSAAGDDKFEFSNRATEVGKLVDDLKSLPDTREEKVAALRDQIRAGDYRPTSQAIADAIIREENIV